jgi:hypothetical protein
MAKTVFKKTSTKTIEKMMKRVRRFDSAEFAKVLLKMPIHGYLVYGANGYASVRVARVAVRTFDVETVDRAISKTERAIIRVK